MSKIIFIATTISLFLFAGLGYFLWSNAESTPNTDSLPKKIEKVNSEESDPDLDIPTFESSSNSSSSDRHKKKNPSSKTLPKTEESSTGNPQSSKSNALNLESDPSPSNPQLNEKFNSALVRSAKHIEFKQRLTQAQGTALLIFVEGEDHEGVPEILLEVALGSKIRKKYTDRDGYALFENLVGGRYKITLVDRDNRRIKTTHVLPMGKGQKRDLTLKLRPFDSSISGQVLNITGDPIPNITVRAFAINYNHHSLPLVQEDLPGEAVSTNDGSFTIEGLPAGEYVIRSNPTETWPTSSTTVTAPAVDVNLLLYEEVDFVLMGYTVDEDGNPVPNVDILASVRGAKTISDEAGSYSLKLKVRMDPEGRITLLSQAEGFIQTTTTIPKSNFDEIYQKGQNILEMDIVLVSEGEIGNFSGRLLNERGEGIVGETVFLSSGSLRARYNDKTKENGFFSIGEVRVADDYQVQVHPQRNYRDFKDGPIEIKVGENVEDFVLEDLDTGTLLGTVIDTDGKPIPDFTFFVRSVKSMANSTRVTTDRNGEFHIEGIPTGELRVENRSSPRLSIRGLELKANEELEVQLPTGFGNHIIQGIITDKTNTPIPGAKVLATLRIQQSLLRTTLFSDVRTDSKGIYTINNFGKGDLELLITSPQFNTGKKVKTIGDQEDVRIDVQLDKK